MSSRADLENGEQKTKVQFLHTQGLSKGFGEIYLPYSLTKKQRTLCLHRRRGKTSFFLSSKENAVWKKNICESQLNV